MHANVVLTNKRLTHVQSNYTNTKLKAWFRRLLCHPARKWSGPILHPQTHTGDSLHEKTTCFSNRTTYPGQLSLPSHWGRWIKYQPASLGFRWGAVTCDQVTLCDPVWQLWDGMPMNNIKPFNISTTVSEMTTFTVMQQLQCHEYNWSQQLLLPFHLHTTSTFKCYSNSSLTICGLIVHSETLRGLKKMTNILSALKSRNFLYYYRLP